MVPLCVSARTSSDNDNENWLPENSVEMRHSTTPTKKQLNRNSQQCAAMFYYCSRTKVSHIGHDCVSSLNDRARATRMCDVSRMAAIRISKQLLHFNTNGQIHLNIWDICAECVRQRTTQECDTGFRRGLQPENSIAVIPFTMWTNERTNAAGAQKTVNEQEEKWRHTPLFWHIYFVPNNKKYYIMHMRRGSQIKDNNNNNINESHMGEHLSKQASVAAKMDRKI